MSTKPFKNKERLRALKAGHVTSSPDEGYDALTLPTKKNVGGPAHQLDFIDDMDDVEPLAETASSSEPYEIPKDLVAFRKAQLLVARVLNQSLKLVAERYNVPLDQLHIDFTDWPFQKKHVTIKHGRNDEHGIPTWTHYSVLVEDLFPPEPEPEEPPKYNDPWDEPAVQQTVKWRNLTLDEADRYMHNTLIQRAGKANPPIAIPGEIIHIEKKPRYLAYYFSQEQWSGGVAQQVQVLINIGALILTSTYP